MWEEHLWNRYTNGTHHNRFKPSICAVHYVTWQATLLCLCRTLTGLLHKLVCTEMLFSTTYFNLEKLAARSNRMSKMSSQPKNVLLSDKKVLNLRRTLCCSLILRNTGVFSCPPHSCYRTSWKRQFFSNSKQEELSYLVSVLVSNSFIPSFPFSKGKMTKKLKP